jgi:hypothetical protein
MPAWGLLQLPVHSAADFGRQPCQSGAETTGLNIENDREALSRGTAGELAPSAGNEERLRILTEAFAPGACVADDPAMQARWGGGDAVATFAALRAAKDNF